MTEPNCVNPAESMVTVARLELVADMLERAIAELNDFVEHVKHAGGGEKGSHDVRP